MSACVPVFGETGASRVEASTLTGQALLKAGDYPGAERAFRQAIADAEPDPRIRDSVAARTAAIALANLLHEQGFEPEAKRLFQKMLRTEGVGAAEKYAALAGLADIDGLSGATEASLREWDDALSWARQLNSTFLEADAERGLGMAWLEAGSPSRAEPLLRKSVATLSDIAGPHSWVLAAALTTLGQCYRLQGKPGLAEDALMRSLDLNRDMFGPGHPQTAYVMERLAEVYAEQHETERARSYSDRAIAGMRSCCGDGSLAMAAALVNRASVEQHGGDLEASAAAYAAALRIAEGSAGNAQLEAKIIARYKPVLKAMGRGKDLRALTAMERSLPKPGAAAPQSTR